MTVSTLTMDPLAETAASLSYGFYCGNCDGTFGSHNCTDSGCASLHDGIYEELKHIDGLLVAAVREREDLSGKHQEAVMRIDALCAALLQHQCPVNGDMVVSACVRGGHCGCSDGLLLGVFK